MDQSLGRLTPPDVDTVRSSEAVIVGDVGWGRAVGVFGVAAALFLGAALLPVPPMLEQHLLLGGIVLQCLWYLALAGLLGDRSGAVARCSG